MEAIIGIAVFVLTLMSEWKVYQKMDRGGWEGLIPIYNWYVLFKVLYGQGWRVLLMLIPIYDLYLIFKAKIDQAHGFGKSTGFGVGLTILPFIFNLILGFGDADYHDGAR